MKKIITLLGSVILLNLGCSPKAESIKPTYVSSIEYDDFSCNQLKSELTKVNDVLEVLSAQQDESANKENTFSLAVLMIGFVSVDVGDEQEFRIGRLKGRYKTIKEVATKKNCSFASELK